ncbi:Hypothetical protein GbCGDNIH6_1547 [Granulibacter bethesdensis]|uniref:hypothetical protein n=1 Tax=Granulibacter bethesdensis TaxID=364410 RepID=UPI00090AA414|nr:hypothetical protein [Granulibacter bethesdensis]APH57340.1 Hypothetical protein GbCGDNIH6_1547 [Granulibacter bethesdensis]
MPDWYWALCCLGGKNEIGIIPQLAVQAHRISHHRLDLVNGRGRGQQAVGAAYYASVAAGKPIIDPASRAAAMAAGVEYLQKHVAPAVLVSAGAKTDAALASAVEAGLGQLLTRDPSMTVGAAGTAATTH